MPETEEQKPPPATLPSPSSNPDQLKVEPNTDTANPDVKPPISPIPSTEPVVIPLDSPLRIAPIHPFIPSILVPREDQNPNANPNSNLNQDPSASTTPTPSYSKILNPATLQPLLPHPLPNANANASTSSTTTASSSIHTNTSTTLPPLNPSTEEVLTHLRRLHQQYPTAPAATRARDTLAEELGRELAERESRRREIERQVGEKERMREIERRVMTRGAGKGTGKGEREREGEVAA